MVRLCASQRKLGKGERGNPCVRAISFTIALTELASNTQIKATYHTPTVRHQRRIGPRTARAITL